MGWSQLLGGKDARKLADLDVDSVLKAIDAGHIIPDWGASKQDWGWSSECDITRDEDGVLFSGSWGISGDTDLPERFAKECRKRKLQVRLGKRS